MRLDFLSVTGRGKFVHSFLILDFKEMGAGIPFKRRHLDMEFEPSLFVDTFHFNVWRCSRNLILEPEKEEGRIGGEKKKSLSGKHC